MMVCAHSRCIHLALSCSLRRRCAGGGFIQTCRRVVSVILCAKDILEKYGIVHLPMFMAMFL